MHTTMKANMMNAMKAKLNDEKKMSPMINDIQHARKKKKEQIVFEIRSKKKCMTHG